MQTKLNLQHVEPFYSQVEDDLAQLLMGQRSANLITHEFGSHQSLVLWNAITKVKDYYLTQAEINLIKGHANKLPHSDKFVDLGPGSDENALAKALPIIDAIKPSLYMPVDISPDFAHQAGNVIKFNRPDIQSLPIIGDWELTALDNVPSRSLVYYSGGSVGNVPLYQGENALDGLQRHLAFLKQKMGDVSLLVTVDTNQSGLLSEKCYNTPLMRWFNHSLWQSFEGLYGIEGLEAQNTHVYSKWQDKAVQHIAQAKEDMTLTLNGYDYIWRKGQTLTQSHSIKPTQDEFIAIANNAGWSIDDIFVSDDNPLKLFLLS